jgi:hypothetical protein
VFETESGAFRLIDSGDLPAAVAASCAIPYIFQPVLGTTVKTKNIIMCSKPTMYPQYAFQYVLPAYGNFTMYLRLYCIIAGNPPIMLADGGFKDRMGLRDWAIWASASADSPRKAIVHNVGTSSRIKKEPSSDSKE